MSVFFVAYLSKSMSVCVVQNARAITHNHVLNVQHYFQLPIVSSGKDISGFPWLSRWHFRLKHTRRISPGSGCYRCPLHAYAWTHLKVVEQHGSLWSTLTGLITSTLLTLLMPFLVLRLTRRLLALAGVRSNLCSG